MLCTRPLPLPYLFELSKSVGSTYLTFSRTKQQPQQDRQQEFLAPQALFRSVDRLCEEHRAMSWQGELKIMEERLRLQMSSATRPYDTRTSLKCMAILSAFGLCAAACYPLLWVSGLSENHLSMFSIPL